MDRRAIIGIVLIVLVTFLMPYFIRHEEQPLPTAPPDSEVVETVQPPPPQPETVAPELPQRESIAEIPEETPQKPALVEKADIEIDSSETVIYIENKYVSATLSNRQGARLSRWELKEYDYYQGGNVDLISRKTEITIPEENGLDTELVDRDGNRIQLADYTLFSDLKDQTRIVLDETNPTATLSFYLPIRGGRIVKEYTFYHDKYSVELVLRFENLQNYMGNRWYSFGWENGLYATEENVSEDYDYARAYVSLGDELESLDISDEETEKMEKSGRVDWTAVRTKYFLAAIIPHTPEDLSVTLVGEGVKEEEQLIKIYSATLGMGFPLSQVNSHVDSFTVYLGPLSISDLSPYQVGLENLVMNRDWYEDIFRPISRWIVLPAFTALHSFIPNYGLVIIVFSILVKLLLHPLTKKSYQSMSQMQVLQPKMTELREQYKNDPQRLNREMMSLYKEQGVNPLGGCLPMLLQMPLLFALFIVFRSTIQLRGEPFMLWMTDLSRPDTLALGFSIPFLGDSIHVLPFLMGLTMIWQSKMTMTDPKQKAMIYFMPLFLIFIFYSLPSGLNLYYAVFNLLSMVQTRMIKKKTPGLEEAGKKSAPKSKPSKAASPKPKPVLPGNRAQRRTRKKK